MITSSPGPTAGRTRRRFIQGSGAALVAMAGAPLRAQTAAATPRHVVISLLGDRINVVYAQMETGSHLDSNVRRSVPDPHGTMDQLALAAVDRALITAGLRGTALLSVAPSPLHEKSDSLFEGGSVVLPANWVDAIEQCKAPQLLLLTKHRAPTSIPMKNGHLGVGMLNGLGYYVDLDSNIQMIETGHTERGLLASFAYFKLTLADAHTGSVLKQRNCTAARAYPVADKTDVVDPWAVLSPTEKVARLRRLLEGELAREVPALLEV